MANLFTVSFSQFDTFQTCPWKYKLKYVDKIRSEFEDTEYTIFGQVVHDVLQKFYDHPPAQLTVDLLLGDWDSAWHQPEVIHFFDDHHVSGLHADYDLKARSFLETFFQRQLSKNGLKQPLLREQPFQAMVEDFRIIGRIDRIDKTTAGDWVIDYKTSLKAIPVLKKVLNSPQLTFYYIGAHSLRGHYPYQLALYYIAFDEILTVSRSKDDVQRLLDDLRQMRVMVDDKDFPARQNALCPFCEYQPECPLFRYNYLAEEHKDFEHDGLAYHFDDVVDTYIRRKAVIKQLSADIDYLKPIIVDYLQQHNLKAIPDKLSLSETPYRDVSFPELLQAARQTDTVPPLERLRLTKDLERYLIELPASVREKVLATMQEKITPVIRVSSRRLKEVEDDQ